jgi:hypothetical protein
MAAQRLDFGVSLRLRFGTAGFSTGRHAANTTCPLALGQSLGRPRLRSRILGIDLELMLIREFEQNLGGKDGP